MTGWILAHERLMWWLVVFSAVTFITSVVAVPWLLVRIPPRYFMTTHHPHPWADRHPLIRVTFLFAKNLFGVILLAIGLALLVLPGQGILTILAATVFLDFPAKHRVLRWTISRPAVLKSVNWIRERAGREPLVVPDDVATKTTDFAD
jgi:Putative transmembrane protein (PGPGW)